ncbi:hypothetical protein ASPSYDRAFT_46344 [Aspergillus sydowii CBS 593.65]|uniref:C2H2-type domain-containing protein n=1 Tax=Aspergillus sydowii CBS 593.65 TaxID=1036612 RepID=A0A1L9TFW4_9EURO|nr:uncharacterized protein ASPSYDRAFT_46344 [Aspergillus sydowii CBS 593.65]OJJ58318.1 hypothetical protein ASPSYDRAFT_46344 [Aspergillus sydowii CBS 593.65]
MASSARRDFICLWKDCGKCFQRNSDLRRHYRTHTNERPYRCGMEGCNKTFIQRSALTVHTRTHTGEKPFICSHNGCRRAFSDSSSLSRHRGVHSNKRAYICPEPTCKRSYRRKSSLRNHQQSSHALDLAIQTLSKACITIKQEQKEEEQFRLPYIPPTPISPQNPYSLCQQGSRDSYYPNIPSQAAEVGFQINVPITPPAATATVPVQGQLPVAASYYHSCAQAPAAQYAQECYFQLMQQQLQQPQNRMGYIGKPPQ